MTDQLFQSRYYQLCRFFLFLVSSLHITHINKINSFSLSNSVVSVSVFIGAFSFSCCSSVTDLCAWAGKESFNGDGSAWSWELSLHDGSHKRLHKGWRQGPPPLHLIQHLQYTQMCTHEHLINLLNNSYVNSIIAGDQLEWFTLENRLKQPRWLTMQ